MGLGFRVYMGVGFTEAIRGLNDLGMEMSACPSLAVGYCNKRATSVWPF